MSLGAQAEVVENVFLHGVQVGVLHLDMLSKAYLTLYNYSNNDNCIRQIEGYRHLLDVVVVVIFQKVQENQCHDCKRRFGEKFKKLQLLKLFFQIKVRSSCAADISVTPDWFWKEEQQQSIWMKATSSHKQGKICHTEIQKERRLYEEQRGQLK